MKRVFVVHGHDLAFRNQVFEHIGSLGLQPLALWDQVNQGETIIEKLEREAPLSDYAIVILSADDLGGRRADFKTRLKVAQTQGATALGITASAATAAAAAARSIPPAV